MNFENFKRIPQQAKMRFVEESAILILFFVFLCILDTTDKKLKHFFAQDRTILGIFAQKNWNPQKKAEHGTVWGIHNSKKNVFCKSVRGFRKLKEESAN